MSVPQVGKKAVGEVRLSPQLRKRLKHRAFTAAQNQYGGAVRADRAALHAVKRQRHTDVRSARGATRMAENLLSRSQAQLKGSGLKGRYLRQTSQEFAGRSADLASGLPALVSQTRATYAPDIQSAQQAILADRQAVQQHAASNLYQLQKEARTRGAATIKARTTHKRSARQDAKDKAQQRRQDLRPALIGLRDFLTHWHSDPKLQKKNPLRSKEDWRTLAVGLSSQYEGVDLPSAQRAIRMYLEQRAPKIIASYVAHAVP